MHEILDDIFIWSRLAEPQGYNFNGYFIKNGNGNGSSNGNGDGNLVIDPVEPSSDDLETMADEGVKHILITNRNHSRDANRVRGQTGAITAIHSSDADHARAEGCLIDQAISDGEMIGPLVAVPVDGKSPGEMAFYWPDRWILFVGDAIIGNPPGQCSLLPEEKLDDPVQLRSSLRALLDVDFDTLLFCDGAPILSGAKARLEELVASFPKE